VFGGIYQVVARVPRGRVATYGQVARMAGLYGGARTVGWALAALAEDREIGGRSVPWHRIVNAAGRISPRGGGPDGPETRRQAARLRREGVAVRDDRVDLDRHLWPGARRPGSGEAG
jgi:methylated-DNA-protein-cysteine methyltransferase-like protein